MNKKPDLYRFEMVPVTHKKGEDFAKTFMDCLDDAIKTLKAIDEGCSGRYVCMCNCELADDFLRRWGIKKS